MPPQAETPANRTATANAAGCSGLQGAGDRDLRLDVLVMIFGMSSWISINGLWVELPLIVNE